MRERTICIALLFTYCLSSMSLVAQDNATQESIEITLFVDDTSLTIFVPDNGAVLLQGLGFQIVVNDSVQQYYLDNYTAFNLLRFGAIPTPLCLRLELNNSNTPLPTSCPTQQTLIQALAVGDVFWYDRVANVSRTISLIQRSNPLIVCGAGIPVCNFSVELIAPTAQPFTLTPTQVTAAQPAINIQVFDGVEMAYVPDGCFMMGSDENERADRGEADDSPRHQVCIERPYFIDLYEVTNQQFINLGGVGAVEGNWDEPNRPREQITWIEAYEYCTFQRGMRLPTEAEWEYAARGPSEYFYPWGNDFNASFAVYGENSANESRDVGLRPQAVSWIGAYDMSGNVWEWVNSKYFPYPFDPNDGREAHDGSPELRVMRGGAWSSPSADLRSTYRGRGSPGYRQENVGFRCARDAG